MLSLPVAGRVALGADARERAEQLLAQARAQGLRTAWLGGEAGFLSNLSVMENLRLMHDWHGADPAAFMRELQAALDVMHMPMPEWLHQRPSQMTENQLVRARVLRVLLLRPDVLVLNPVLQAQAGDVMTERLLAALPQARLFLLAEARPEWPAWPASESSSDAVEDNPA